jgi:hypothetical protein
LGLEKLRTICDESLKGRVETFFSKIAIGINLMDVFEVDA